MEYTVTVEVELTEDKYLDVDFTGDISYDDVGIGSYEYWGIKGVDTQMAWVIDDLYWDKTLYSQEENTEIERWYHENISYLEDKIIKAAEQDSW